MATVPSLLLHLQRTSGNRAVSDLIRRMSTTRNADLAGEALTHRIRWRDDEPDATTSGRGEKRGEQDGDAADGAREREAQAGASGAAEATPAQRATGQAIRARQPAREAEGRTAAHLAPVAIRRVPLSSTVDRPGGSETLLWDQNTPAATAGGSETATQQLQPRTFTLGAAHYQMTRDAGAVRISVPIVFVSTDGTAIPDGDERRAWASGMCTTLVQVWNGAAGTGRYEFFGHRNGGVSGTGGAAPAPAPAPAPGVAAPPGAPPPGDVRLSLIFSATPSFDTGADAAIHRVQVHPSSQAATGSLSGGTAITAGDWFMNINSANYGASAQSIYAHEYGHLLGIPDEYSQSNPQMHALFHQVSPSSEARMNEALDQATVDLLVMRALQPQLLPTVHAVAGQVATAVEGKHRLFDRQVADAIRQSWHQSDVGASVVSRLDPLLRGAGQQHAARALPEACRFERFDNLSNLSLARQAVAQELNPSAIETIVRTAFTDATRGNDTPTIHYLDAHGVDTTASVKIELSTGATAAGSPLDTAAGAAAGASTTPTPAPAVPSGTHVPAVHPSPNLIGQLTAMPGAWQAADIQGQLSSLPSDIKAAVAAITFDPGGIHDNVHQLYRELLDMVNNVSDAVARSAVRAFLTTRIRQVVDTQVAQIASLVKDEVMAHHTATGTGTAASPGAPPDPAVLASAQQMATAIQALIQRPPAAPPGAAAAPAATPQSAAPTTPQDVKYTMNSLMGDNAASDAVRPDNLAPVLDEFNARLRHKDPGGGVGGDEPTPFEVRTK